jgi:two-component system cell cycle sensor histidine kinase/response regulator CckA
MERGRSSLWRTIRVVLAAHGYTVLTARDGEEGVRLSREHRETIRMLVTDVVMPGMGGRALAEEIGRERPRIKVLYMSGYTSDALGEQGVLAEGIELIEKPFTPAELVERVRKVLDA